MRNAMPAWGLPIYGWLSLASFLVTGCARAPLCPVGLDNRSQPLVCQPLGDQFDTPEPRLLAAAPRVAAAPVGGHSYCGLTAEECQRRAAAHAPKAERRAADMAFAAAATHERRGACLARLQYDLYAIQADGERVTAAGAALEAFYELFLVEQEAIRLDDALSEIAAMEAELERADAAALAVAFDASSLARRRLEIDRQRAESVAARAQLNSRLRRLLGDDTQDALPLWPKSDATVTPETLDRHAAAATAQAERADLKQLRAMLGALDAETLPLVRQVVAQLDNTAPPVTTTLRAMRSERDLLLRREQLEHLLAERQRLVAGEVKTAADAVTTRRQRIAIARRVLANWQARVKEIEQLQELGKGTRLETGAARLEAIAAESALLREVVGWKIARVRFRTAQGLLPLDAPTAAAPLVIEAPQASPEFDHTAARLPKRESSRVKQAAHQSPLAPPPPPEKISTTLVQPDTFVQPERRSVGDLVGF